MSHQIRYSSVIVLALLESFLRAFDFESVLYFGKHFMCIVLKNMRSLNNHRSLTFRHHTLFSDGGVGGSCAGNLVCLDGHSSCIGNICACNAGYSDVEGECYEGVYLNIFLFFIYSTVLSGHSKILND